MPYQSRFLWAVTPPTVRGAGKAFFSLRIEREAELPEPPFVIAANHYSHFDSPLIGAVVDMPIRYLALEDLFGVNRLLDWLIEGYGSIPTPRYRAPVGAVRTALSALDNGEVVGVFPEAIRVSHWGTLPPKRGAAWLAIQTGVPVVPMAVIGTGRAFGLENRLRRARIRVVVGEPLQPETDPLTLTNRWAKWISAQVARFPGSEVTGPRRTTHDVEGGSG